jgi:hypothetical protein
MFSPENSPIKASGARSRPSTMVSLVPIWPCNPIAHVSGEVSPGIQVIDTDKALELEALRYNRVNVAWPCRGAVVLADHAAKRETGKVIRDGDSRFQVSATDVVKIDINPLRCCPAQCCFKVGFLVVVDHGVQAKIFSQPLRLGL